MASGRNREDRGVTQNAKATMAKCDSENFLILHQSPAPGSLEERYERVFREIFGGMRGRDGRAIDYDVRRKKVNPARTLVAKLAKAKRKRVPKSEVVKIVRALDQYVNEVWPEPADEYRQRQA
jgi:hypothetical protein